MNSLTINIVIAISSFAFGFALCAVGEAKGWWKFDDFPYWPED